MPETFEEALQTSGGVDLTGLRSEGAGGDTHVLASDPATWRRAFRFICARRTEPIGQPIVDLVLVRGFALAGCTGQQICEQSTTLTGINLFEPYKLPQATI
jgi:hypothetical protein